MLIFIMLELMLLITKHFTYLYHTITMLMAMMALTADGKILLLLSGKIWGSMQY